MACRADLGYAVLRTGPRWKGCRPARPHSSELCCAVPAGGPEGEKACALITATERLIARILLHAVAKGKGPARRRAPAPARRAAGAVRPRRGSGVGSSGACQVRRARSQFGPSVQSVMCDRQPICHSVCCVSIYKRVPRDTRRATPGAAFGQEGATSRAALPRAHARRRESPLPAPRAGAASARAAPRVTPPRALPSPRAAPPRRRSRPRARAGCTRGPF